MNTCEETLKKLMDTINTHAKRKTVVDVGNDVYGVSGGNIDDAYSAGIQDGYTYFARDLKRMLE